MKYSFIRNVFVIALGLLPMLTWAQIGNEKYEPGTIYLTSGDTLEVTIKPDRAERLSRQISVWDNQIMGAKRYLPKDLTGFYFQNETYLVKKDSEGKKHFMVLQTKGDVSLLAHTYKEDKGKEEVVTDYYLEKKGTGFYKVPSNKNKFRTEMSYYFADDLSLAQKIDDKMYQFGDIEAVVEEYNENKAAKSKPLANNPDNPSTQPDPQNPDNNQSQEPVNPNTDTPPISNPADDQEIYPILRDNLPKGGNSTIGVEAMGLLTYNIFAYPNSLNSLFRVKSGGVGFEFGVGFRATLKRGLTFRTGINIKDKAFKFESNSLQIVDNNGNVTVLNLKESGRTYYPGIYFNIGQEWKYFMIGGGFNMSFYSMYRGKYEISGGGIQASETKAKQSFMVHDLNRPDGADGNFNMQLDVNVTAGARFKIGEKLTLKPFVQYSIPMFSLYNTGIMVQGSTGNVELNVHGYAIKVGLIADFGNW